MGDDRQSSGPARTDRRRRSGGRRPGGRPAGRRRRRRGDQPTPTDKAAPALPTPSPGRQTQRALQPSQIDTAKAADEPFTPEEAAEMRSHLQFLFRHRKSLRLRLNAAEDLLLTGARPATHRGQCMHLLAKVDLSCLQSALARLSEARERSALLAGVVRFSTDAGVLLLYLESLTEEASRAEAAAAFGLAVGRIDFAQVSPARMRKVLELIATTFFGQQRIQVLFGLLRSDSFRTAFDRSTEILPDELAEAFIPLRAVYEVVFQGRRDRFGAEQVGPGVSMLLEAPESILRGYPRDVRERLLTHAVSFIADTAAADRATDILLDSLPRDSSTHFRLGLRRAAELLARSEDDRAEKLLARLQAAQPQDPVPRQWLAAVRAPHIGRIARLDATEAEAGRPRLRGRRLERGLWLDQQLPVWLRAATGDAAGELLEEIRIQREVAFAGVLPVLLAERVETGSGFVAMPAIGEPLPRLLGNRGPGHDRPGRDRPGRDRPGHDRPGRDRPGRVRPGRDRPGRVRALALALTGVQILHSLTRAGVALPDLDPARFVAEDGPWPALFLADFQGAHPASADRGAAARELALGWCRRLLTGGPRYDRARGLTEALDASPEIGELISILSRLLG